MLLALGQGQGQGFGVKQPKSWWDFSGKTAQEQVEVMMCARPGCKHKALLQQAN